MINQLLVPLDGSALAEQAIPHAGMLAHATGSTLTLLRVVDSIGVMPPFGMGAAMTSLDAEALDEERSQAEVYLAELVARLAPSQVVVQTVVDCGHPVEVIDNYATAHAEGLLIVMATHGRSGVGRWVFGSVAEGVLHGVSAPLLLVRATDTLGPAEIPPYETILLPLDGSPASEQALAQAGAMAGALGANLILMSAVPAARDNRPRDWLGIPDPPILPTHTTQGELALGYLSYMSESLREDGIEAETQIVYGEPAPAILQACAEAGADLIVMATHGNSGLKRITIGSVALKVAQASQCPVLLIRVRFDSLAN